MLVNVASHGLLLSTSFCPSGCPVTLFYFLSRFQEPASKVCHNERSLLPKSCAEKYHQSVPKRAVRRHAPCQQLHTRCKGQPWLVTVLVLPTEGYCWGTRPDMDAILALPSVCTAHSPLLVPSMFSDEPVGLDVIVAWRRRGGPRPDIL